MTKGYSIDIDQVIRMAGGLENLLRNMGTEREGSRNMWANINSYEVLFKGNASKPYRKVYIYPHYYNITLTKR